MGTTPGTKSLPATTIPPSPNASPSRPGTQFLSVCVTMAGTGAMNNRLRAAVTTLAPILGVALAVRLLFLYDYVRQNPHHALGVIPFLFESGDIAVSLATGHGFSSPFRVATGPTAWMTPVYPLLLAGIFRIFGVYTFRSYLAAALFNISCVTLACVPLYYAARRIGGRALAASATWLWAMFPNAILLTFESMWEACLSALLAATILWATLALTGSRRLRDWCAYGLLWGLALMTNPVLASLLPLLLGWLAWRAWRERRPRPLRESLARPALALVLATLCCVPWTIRNYRVFHSFVPWSSVLGLQLWQGNNPQARPIWLAHLHPINDQAERAAYMRMGEIAYMKQKFHLAVAYMITHPRRELVLISRRFLAIWSGGTPYPFRDFLATHSPWFRYVLLFNLLAALAAAAAIVVLFRRRSEYAFPLAVFPLVFPWAYYLTLAYPRYRFPIDPVVILLAAIALLTLFRGKIPSPPS
jgi:4-amino-4-deoxy-L-arabinose transferase-like glycosyltransferase